MATRDTINQRMKRFCVSGLLFFCIYLPSHAQGTRWIGSWGASPSPQLAAPAQMLSNNLLFENQTIREIVHTSAGGSSIRVRLSNAYGRESVTIGAAHVALRDRDSSITASSDHALTFSGRPSTTIPPDATVLSDAVQLDIPALHDVVVSLYLPKAATGAGIHYSAQQTSYIGPGDQTTSASFQRTANITSWVFLTGLDVAARSNAATLVAFGDSITDGALSTVDANRRWPNILAERVAASHSEHEIGVLDEGIGGNRILHDASSEIQFGVNALARFDRDVLAQPNVQYVIVLEGINDIGHPGSSAPNSQDVSAEEIIAGLTQMIDRAHEKGLKIFGGTLTPFEGTVYPGYFSPQKEIKRKAVNEWIRTSHAFDGVVDFDKAVRDPAHPDRMLPRYDGGDHLHPSDAGYKAMGDAIDLGLFQ
jgi:lysophospholipase L1-like esterase